MMSNICKAVCVSVAATVAFAMGVDASFMARANTFTTPGKIEQAVASVNFFRVHIPNAPQNEGCAISFHFILEQSHTNYETIVATLLSAQHAKKDVHLLINGCSGNNPKISAAYVYSE